MLRHLFPTPSLCAATSAECRLLNIKCPWLCQKETRHFNIVNQTTCQKASLCAWNDTCITATYFMSGWGPIPFISLPAKTLILIERICTTMDHESITLQEIVPRWNLNQRIQDLLPLCRPLISRNGSCCWIDSSQGRSSRVAHGFKCNVVQGLE